jgi:hypothetical protein
MRSADDARLRERAVAERLAARALAALEAGRWPAHDALLLTVVPVKPGLLGRKRRNVGARHAIREEIAGWEAGTVWVTAPHGDPPLSYPLYLLRDRSWLSGVVGGYSWGASLPPPASFTWIVETYGWPTDVTERLERIIANCAPVAQATANAVSAVSNRQPMHAQRPPDPIVVRGCWHPFATCRSTAARQLAAG